MDKARRKSVQFVNETHTRLNAIVIERLPWLIVGLLGGIFASFMVSRFEDILAQNISLAFFVPVIVYMSGAVGLQTETIFVRDLADHRANFWKYIWKEIMVGLYLGIILGVSVGVIAFMWLKDLQVAVIVGLAMLVNVMIAPLLALIVPEVLFKEHSDPALGAGPFVTVIMDFVSLLVYFLIATIIISQKFIY